MPVNGRTPAYAVGLIIPFWLLLGLIVTSHFYPGYSHINQAMSALGAVGSPTQAISPLIDNYPLGLFFIIFSLGVIFTPNLPRLGRFTGVLIGLHGLANLFTGYFPCDALCKPVEPSASQLIHNTAGFAMLLTLLAASALWSWLAFRVQERWFGFWSIILTFATVASIPWMAAAAQMETSFGLYQRFNYFSQLIWVAVFAWMLIRRQARA
ncbi:DUF998 domain-containing protein [Pseudomonas sp. KNUC1026]|uniref:DUF998 domain-containing protein n=1 Tax=Pseudomonas sp. KNUC1026 TaxID=2893890 RepID=UPI001F1D19A9|nr:DUF998 domain-containing protein [Pseudomonas sp. KNUC1026]UFH48407.1 DUF998 domain-containing protein [Pseudomonas sp. KNUC1026]